MSQPELISLQMTSGKSLEAMVSVGSKAVVVTTVLGQTSFNPASVYEVCIRIIALMDGKP